MIYELLINLNFWSAFSGLLGSIVIFFFGLSPKIDNNGQQDLILEQVDEKEKTKQIFTKKLVTVD